MTMKKTTPSSGNRIESLDAFRGFDMFWIMGAPAIIWSLDKIFGGTILGWLSIQMHHAKWDGLRIMDMVFPTFLFIAGCSFPLSLMKRREKGQKDGAIYKHIFVRTFWMVLLGCVYNGLLQFDFEHMRYASVLGRIGLAWMFASLLFMHLSQVRVRLALPFLLLIIYSLIIGCFAAPDALAGADIYSKDGSIVGWVDRMILPGRLYLGTFDPEGVLAVIPAVSTAFLGMLTGDFLRKAKQYNPYRMIRILSLSAIALIVAGMVWSIWEPINKSLWTSSFTLVAAGISMLLLVLFYWLIDVKGWKKWAFFFKIIGVNSLLIYLAQAIINFYGIGQYFLGGVASLFGEAVGGLILSCGYVAACWLFLYFMYKHKVFLKI